MAGDVVIRGQVSGSTVEMGPAIQVDADGVVQCAIVGTSNQMDLIEIGGNTVTAGAGNVGTGTLRVTLAADDPAVAHLANVVTALQIMDDWDATEDSAIGNDGAVQMIEAKSSQKTAVADADAVIPVANLNGELVNAGYTWATESNRVEEIDPLSEHHVEETILDVENITTNTTNYVYFDMDGFRNFTLQGDMTIATDSITVTVEATVEDDGTAPASCFYTDVTNALFGVASWVDTDFMAICDTPCAFKYVRVKYVTSNDSGDDSDLTLYLKKMY